MEEKIRLSSRVTREQHDRVKERADKLGMFLGQYISEIAMWDARYNMLPRLRDGARLVGRKRK